VQFKQAVIAQTNITLVYESLSTSTIDLNRLRKELVGGLSPVITEIPDNAIALMYPQLQIGCMIGNNRVQVNDGSQEPVGSRPISAVVHAAHNIIGSKLIAFGFNYEVLAVFDQDDLPASFKARFLCNPEDLEARLGGTIHNVGLRLNYRRESVACQLVLEPVEISKLRAHLNVHFESVNQLPEANQLNASFQQEFDNFMQVLKAL